MIEHLFLAPIDSLAESVGILKHGIIANRRSCLTSRIIINYDAVNSLIERVKVFKLAVFDFDHIEPFILS